MPKKRPASRRPGRGHSPATRRTSGPRPGARAGARAGTGSRGTPPHAANASRLRKAVERRSYPALVWMAGKPRWLPALALGVLLVAGLLLGGVVGGLLLAIIAGYAGWLTYLAWPAVAVGGRLFRLATLAALVLVAAITMVRG